LKTNPTPLKEQTEDTRNLSELGREATTLRSPTPDPAPQVRINIMFFLKRGVMLLRVNHLVDA